MPIQILSGFDLVDCVIRDIYVPDILYVIRSYAVAEVMAYIILITTYHTPHTRIMECLYNLFCIVYLYKLYNMC